jgi:hypothetical protein
VRLGSTRDPPLHARARLQHGDARDEGLREEEEEEEVSWPGGSAGADSAPATRREGSPAGGGVLPFYSTVAACLSDDGAE